MTGHLFACGDLHFSHASIIKHCNRPFSSVHEMNKALVDNWNAVIPPINSHVFILGDFVWGSRKKVRAFNEKLNGNKYLIRGNHDRKNLSEADGFAWVKDYYELKFDEHVLVMLHYPMLSWNRKHYGSIHLHGHTHRPDSDYAQRRINVGVDLWNFAPVSIGDLCALV